MFELSKWFRFCPICNQGFRPVDWVCNSCFEQFLHYIDPQKRQLAPGIEHHYLVEWDPRDHSLDPYVYSLKGGRTIAAYRWLLQFFGEVPRGYRKQPIYFPSRGQRDHAWVLAKLIAEKTQGEFRAILKKQSQKQALLGRGERSRQTFEIQRAHSAKRAFFVDDIVTSGSTVLGCYKALGQPQNMTVWSLFYRKNL